MTKDGHGKDWHARRHAKRHKFGPAEPTLPARRSNADVFAPLEISNQAKLRLDALARELAEQRKSPSRLSELAGYAPHALVFLFSDAAADFVPFLHDFTALASKKEVGISQLVHEGNRSCFSVNVPKEKWADFITAVEQLCKPHRCRVESAILLSEQRAAGRGGSHGL